MKKIIKTENAPAAIGPYSQAVMANGMLYMSGQIALIPETGEVVDEGIEAQTIRVLKNMEGVLSEAGLTFDDVVKTTVFLTDMEDFGLLTAFTVKSLLKTLLRVPAYRLRDCRKVLKLK